MKVYVNTRFSVEDGLNGVVKDLYDPERLRFRIRTLRDVCIPSVESQSYQNIEHRIFFSENINSDIKESLYSVSGLRTKLIPLKKGRQAFFDASKTSDERSIHINLDDDDSIAPWYVEFLVNSCKDHTSGEVIMTYLHGAVVKWKEEDCDDNLKTFSSASAMFYKLNNQGLAILTSKGQGTVTFGNHTKILTNFPELTCLELSNEGKIGWIRTESKNSHHKTYHPKTLVVPPFLAARSINDIYS